MSTKCNGQTQIVNNLRLSNKVREFISESEGSVLTAVPPDTTFHAQPRLDSPLRICRVRRSRSSLASRDELAFESHRCCARRGLLPVFHLRLVDKTQGTSREVFGDEGIWYPPSMPSLERLNMVFNKNGVVTAGNASQISDGSSAILLAPAEAVRKYGGGTQKAM